MLIGCYTLFGVAVGAINPPISNTAIEGMPPSMTGVAAAVASVGRQIGTALGVAIAGSLLADASAPAQFVAASRRVWILIVALGIPIIILAIISTTPWAHRTAERAAGRIDRDLIGISAKQGGTQ